MANKKLVIIVLLLMAPLSAKGADFAIHPSITVVEEFTDNVFETTNHRVSDFITRALPGISLSYRMPALESDIAYQYDYRYYARKTRASESTMIVNARAHVTAVNNLLFIDVSDVFERVSLEVARDVTRESLFVNQADRNVATISPYILYRPSEQSSIKAGYAFSDTRYFDVADVSLSRATLDKRRHTGFFEGGYEVTSRLTANVGYNYVHEEAEANDYNEHQPYGGFRYEYANGSLIFAQAGNTWILYDNGMRLSDLFWHIGVNHNFDILTAYARTGVRYDEDPLRNITEETFVTGGVKKDLQNGSVDLGLYYSEFVATRMDDVILLLNPTRSLPSKKYGASIQGQTELLTNLTGTLSFTAEKYEYGKNEFRPESTYVRRFLLETSLGYQLTEQANISVYYTYADNHSPSSVFSQLDNRWVNRIGLQVRAVF